MRCKGTSKPKNFPKSGGKLFAPPLFSALAAFAAIAVAGCAEIPSDSEGGVSEVVVEVAGGNADIFPGLKFNVPVGGDTLLFVDVNREANTRIAEIWVDGGRQCCAKESVVRYAWVSLTGVKGGVAVKVRLAEIDTVMPVAELLSPASAEIAANVPICSFGELEYRLNKTMEYGYIKWWKNIADDGWEDRDSLQVVRIPGDITKYSHDTGGWLYTSPSDYLSEGLQKFSLTVSPVAGKRVSISEIAYAVYSFEIQFADSLGNKSEKVVRNVWTSNVIGGCR